MEVEEAKSSSSSSSGYGKPPWIFKGSALYQFHLVKAEIARAIIPKHFRLVEAFGYTLGGFFLAKYHDSPVGTFDELVVMAGIVWNPPISHAWAARVYVNNDEACRHGRKEFGLPSQVATFSKSMSRKSNGMDVQLAEMNGHVATGLYNIGLAASSSPSPSLVLKMNPWKWMGIGPTIKMSLPSFSGHTEYNPHLLKYYCQIECRVKPTWPARVRVLASSELKNGELMKSSCCSEKEKGVDVNVMLSKPILALEFNCLQMQVQPPVIVSHRPLHSPT